MLKSRFRQHPYLMSSLALTLALTLLFAVRFLIGVIYWSTHQEEPIRPWMTVGYIGKSWGLDPHTIDITAGLPHPPQHPLTLAEIADQQGVPVTDVIRNVEGVVAKLRAAKH